MAAADVWRFQIDPVMGHAHDSGDHARSLAGARSTSPSRRLLPQLAMAVEELARPWRRRDEPDEGVAIRLDETMRTRLDRAAAIWQRNVRTAVAALHLAAAAAGDERLAGFVAELLEDAYLERINHLYDRLRAHCEALDFCIELSRPAALPPLAAELMPIRHTPTARATGSSRSFSPSGSVPFARASASDRSRSRAKTAQPSSVSGSRLISTSDSRWRSRFFTVTR
jgi:hypothetical protein